MPTLTTIVTIHRPADEVASTFFDWTRDPWWRPAVRRMSVDPSGPAVPGQQVVEELRFVGLSFVTATRIDSVHPRRVVWSGGSRRLVIRGWRELEAAGPDQCRVKQVVDVELRGPLRLLTPALSPAYRSTMRADLAGLGRLLEGSVVVPRARREPPAGSGGPPGPAAAPPGAVPRGAR